MERAVLGPTDAPLAETITGLRQSGRTLVLADCGSGDVLAARDSGADIIGTTLSGYTTDRPRTDGPDLELLAQLVSRMPGTPIVAEGRIHTPAQAKAAVATGAHAVVVGPPLPTPPPSPAGSTGR